MRERLARWCVAGVLLLGGLSGPTALAQSASEIDARLLGYEQNPVSEEESNALTYLLFAGLLVLVGSVLFAGQRRTHLD